MAGMYVIENSECNGACEEQHLGMVQDGHSSSILDTKIAAGVESDEEQD